MSLKEPVVCNFRTPDTITAKRYDKFLYPSIFPHSNKKKSDLCRRFFKRRGVSMVYGSDNSATFGISGTISTGAFLNIP